MARSFSARPIDRDVRPPMVVRLWLAWHVLLGATSAARLYGPLKSTWALSIEEIERNTRR